MNLECADRMEDMEDTLIYTKIFPKDSYRSYPYIKNFQLDEKLSNLISWVTQCPNWIVRNDDIESYRTRFIDFLYLFQYFHDVVHFQSRNVDKIFDSIKAFNSEYFWPASNMHDMKHIKKFLNTQIINRNCYTEVYFNPKIVTDELMANTHFLRLYSSLTSFNNNPHFRKFKDNLELFNNSIKHFEDEDHERVTDYINALNLNGEKIVLTRDLMWLTIDNICLGRIFKIYQLNMDDSDFFMLMNLAFKNFLYQNSGVNSISTLQNMIDIIQPDLIEDTVNNFLCSISNLWVRPINYKINWPHDVIKFCQLTHDIKGKSCMTRNMMKLQDKKSLLNIKPYKYCVGQKTILFRFFNKQLYISCKYNSQTCTP